MNNSFFNPSRVKEQYKNSDNLDARIRLHSFNTNKTDWSIWFFEKMDIPENGRILELGCGNGMLWQKNAHSVRENWDITLSDFSEGILESAKQNISSDKFKFEIIDIQNIPYEDETFDVIIARHMLYHVPNIGKAICEVRRILKSDGKFYVSTNGIEHMQELENLVKSYDANIDLNLKKFAVRFGLENGCDILKKYFDNVSMEEFNGRIVVDKAEYVVGYVASINRMLSDLSQKESFHKYVNEKISKSGQLVITTKTGMLTALKDCWKREN